MKRTLLIATAMLVATNVAFGEDSRSAIDGALPTAKLTPAERAQVIKYRKQGEQLHNGGNHGKAEAILQKAKAILKILHH